MRYKKSCFQSRKNQRCNFNIYCVPLPAPSEFGKRPKYALKGFIMNIVIAGGGNVGYYLAKTLCERKYHISIIEQSMVRCEWIERSNLGRNPEIIHGDSTDERILRDAGVMKCDTFIAVTGQDQNNLTSCLLAKQLLEAKRTIARVNNPKNIRVFQRLGVNSVISSADRISDMIEQEMEWTDLDSILSEKTDNARIKQCLVGSNSKADDCLVSKLKMPSETIIIVVVRGNRAYIPNGAFRLAAGDELIMMGSQENLHTAEKLFFREVSI